MPNKKFTYAFGLAALSLSLSLYAQPIQEAQSALQRQEYGLALRILSDAVLTGDKKARTQLSSLLINLPAPYREPTRGCTLAQMGTQDGDSMAMANLAQCLMMGLVPSNHPYSDAREVARRSYQLGDPAGGFMLYLTFVNDPDNSYLLDGKPNLSAYNALAARPIEARTNQIEALDALAFSMSKGHMNAALMLSTYFYETAAPNSVARLRGLTSLLLRNGEKAPILSRYLQQANSIEKLGTSKASVKGFFDAYSVALGAATLIPSHENQKCQQLQLKTIASGDLENPVFLPLKFKSIENSYLTQGSWKELWKFNGCGKDIPVTVLFKADGWGGVKYSAEVAKPELQLGN